MNRNSVFLILIVLLLGLSLWVVLPPDGERLGKKGFQFGLDLQGGTHLVYQADLSKKDATMTDGQVMDSLVRKIEQRVNAYGTGDLQIAKQGDDKIVVDIPGVRDIDEAISLIGNVAILEVYEAIEKGEYVYNADGSYAYHPASGTLSDGSTTDTLTGKYLKSASVGLDSTTNKAVVQFTWNDEGAILFEQITTRNLNKYIAIYLDGVIISEAVVNSVISDVGMISGMEAKDCQNLAIQLNIGALDVPLEIIQRADVDATLGSDSLNKSLIAGIIGIIIVAAFMIYYYGVSGTIVAVSLAIYCSIVLAIYKLLPVTLTLPSIAGFVISVGMAVDANILIFERLKEELLAGRNLRYAIDEAFRRAWPSIRDSNIATFITCGILYWFGSSFGAFMVKGFAITLFIGVAVSMFSAILITRSFIKLLIGEGIIKGLSFREVKKNA
ncbi:MAG: protein translocase subunit SecD [Dehalococcoidia bacterium]|nr:protein translocase subunit SecD [Dehalococcoidia bacterium]